MNIATLSFVLLNTVDCGFQTPLISKIVSIHAYFLPDLVFCRSVTGQIG